MKLLAAAPVALLMAVAGTVPAMADTTTSTLEPPAFSTGAVDGQHGWSAAGNYDYGVVANGLGAPGRFGRQSFRISSKAASGAFDWAFSPEIPNEAGEASNHSRFTAEFSFLALGAQVDGSHISVSPDRGDGARMSYVRLEDQPDGVHAIFIDRTDVDGGPTAENSYDIATLDRSVPHTVKFDMQFVDGPSNDVVNVSIDGNLVKTGTSWENYFRFQEHSPVPNVSRLIFQARGNSTNFGAVSPEARGFLIDNVTVGTPDDRGPQGPKGSEGSEGSTGALGSIGPVGPIGPIGAASATAPKLVGNQLRVINVARLGHQRLLD